MTTRIVKGHIKAFSPKTGGFILREEDGTWYNPRPDLKELFITLNQSEEFKGKEIKFSADEKNMFWDMTITGGPTLQTPGRPAPSHTKKFPQDGRKGIMICRMNVLGHAVQILDVATKTGSFETATDQSKRTPESVCKQVLALAEILEEWVRRD